MAESKPNYKLLLLLMVSSVMLYLGLSKKLAKINNNSPGINLKDIPEIQQVFNKEAYHYYLLFYFRDICASCQSGKMISTLNDLFRACNFCYIFVFLSEDFSQNDIDNLINNLNIEFKLEKIPLSLKKNMIFW